MKLLDVDWHEVFDLLPKWEALAIGQRRFLIELSLTTYGTRSPDDELVDGVWLERVRSRSGTRYRVPRPHRFWLKLCRELSRATPFPDQAAADRDAGAAALENYLLQHYTAQEIEQLDRRGTDGTRYRLARDMRGAAWWRRFLDWNGEPPPTSVLDPHSRWQEASPIAVTTAQELIGTIVAHGGPIAITDLLEATGKRSRRAALAAGLAFAFREALLLLAVDAVMLPFVGIWPPILKRLQRGTPATIPEPTFRGDDLLRRPFLIDDMATLLMEAIAEPPRLKAQSHELFVRNARAIGTALPALPAWVDPEFAPLNRDRRVSRAAQFAFSLRLAASQRDSGTGLKLVVTETGRQWLMRSVKERLKQILDVLRDDAMLYGREDGHVLDPWYAEDPEAVPLDFVPYVYEIGWFLVNPVRGVLDAFRAVGRESTVDLRAFVHFHSEQRNPLLERDEIAYGAGEDAERIWGSTLLAFFYERLVPLGGVALGLLADGDAGFVMTDIGRCLLGEVDDFELDTPADSGDVVVQPNFEIVFLSPSPIDQVRARTFAAPTAALQGPQSVGTLFVIDRASVQRAVMAGRDAEEVIATAGALSKQRLPANVSRQIRDWAAEVRWVDVCPALVVHCGDAETAARVLAAVGKRGRRLSDSVVELVDRADLTPAMRRKLISRGVFVRSAG